MPNSVQDVQMDDGDDNGDQKGLKEEEGQMSDASTSSNANGFARLAGKLAMIPKATKRTWSIQTAEDSDAWITLSGVLMTREMKKGFVRSLLWSPEPMNIMNQPSEPFSLRRRTWYGRMESQHSPSAKARATISPSS